MTALTRTDFRFFHPLRVRWAEVDMQKVVFNAHYLMYFDTAMTDYWRFLGLPYEVTMHAMQGEPFVKKATVEFHASARLDDQLEVALKCDRIGTSSMWFTGAIFRGDQLLITGELLYVFADPVAQTSRPVPDALRDIFLSYEAWEPMVTVDLGSWQTVGVQAGQLRADIFNAEQAIPMVMEGDPTDELAVHALARNRLGLAVATGRLLQHGPGVGQIGRMAVNRVLRGTNVGRDVLRALMQAATLRGDHEVLVHARRSAEGFYARLGFVRRGEPFEEGGIVHVEMVHTLPAHLV
jgi:YbgC/YbaW family acyl-CoA thioester hydrolase